jgi:hypothetical protein
MRPHAAASRFRLERSGVGVVVIEVSECMRPRPLSNPGGDWAGLVNAGRQTGELDSTVVPPLDSLPGSMARTLNVKPVIFAFAAPFSLR